MYNSKYEYVKRFSDVALSAAGAVVLALPMGIIALCIKAESKGNVFFKQDRVGKNKKIFKILKFRTMYSDTPKDVPTHLLNNPEAFITKTGGFLRKTSLDELPQLFNIIKGDMSLVGPRPALYNQYDLIAERDKYGANNIRPGLTGLAQIKGRDELPIEVKAAYDGEYVKKMCFLTDLKIIGRTFVSVIREEGIREGAAKGKQRKIKK
ncbi:MAG: sugar transferase [Clostridiales bacterium]|nr:sugar transferase [Clostridiales bacterium]MCD8216321.1 sugar transferase [Clostridiales bacterium]